MDLTTDKKGCQLFCCPVAEAPTGKGSDQPFLLSHFDVCQSKKSKLQVRQEGIAKLANLIKSHRPHLSISAVQHATSTITQQFVYVHILSYTFLRKMNESSESLRLKNNGLAILIKFESGKKAMMCFG